MLVVIVTVNKLTCFLVILGECQWYWWGTECLADFLHHWGGQSSQLWDTPCYRRDFHPNTPGQRNGELSNHLITELSYFNLLLKKNVWTVLWSLLSRLTNTSWWWRSGILDCLPWVVQLLSLWTLKMSMIVLPCSPSPATTPQSRYVNNYLISIDKLGTDPNFFLILDSFGFMVLNFEGILWGLLE